MTCHATDSDGPASRAPIRHPGGMDDQRDLFRAIEAGHWPPADGGLEVVPGQAEGIEAVLAFTGHAVVVTGRALTVAELAEHGADGYGGAHAPAFLLWFAGHRRIGTLDLMLVRHGSAPGRDAGSRFPTEHRLADPPVPTSDHDDHPRVRYARQRRHEVEVYADRHALVTVGAGLGDRLELSVERFDHLGDPGSDGNAPALARPLLHGVLEHIVGPRSVWASVAPGNARSLRTFLAAGFRPVGAEVLVMPDDRA